MSVRVSPVSRTAAILLMALGAFTLFAGLAASDLVTEVAGGGIIVVGAFLYWLLYRLTRRIVSDLKEATEAKD